MSDDKKFLSSINPVELAKKFGDKIDSPFYRKLAISSAEKMVQGQQLLTFYFSEQISKGIRNCIERIKSMI